jgi:glycosyltransferase involved in cell wall biosynthesis
MDSKKVLIAHIPYQFRGGEDTHVDILKEVYTKLGFSVHLAFKEKPKVSGLNNAIKMWRSLKEKTDFDFSIKDFDLIHLHNAFPFLGPAFFREVIRQKKPMLFTVHNHRFFCTNGLAFRSGSNCKICLNNNKEKKISFKPFFYNCNADLKKSLYHNLAINECIKENLYQRAVTKFLVPSKYLENVLLEWGAPPNKVVHLPNPIQKFNVDDIDLDFSFDVLYAGRLSYEKGIDRLIELIKITPKVRYCIVGSGPLLDFVKEETKNFINVILLPEKPHHEILSLIRKAKLGVVLSRCNENFPTFVFECLLNNKQVVMAKTESADSLSSRYGLLSLDFSNLNQVAKTIEDYIQEKLIAPINFEALKEVSIENYRENLKKILNEIL